jgi:hypothetical protein
MNYVPRIEEYALRLERDKNLLSKNSTAVIAACVDILLTQLYAM